ncbi:hypothetical protein IAU60_000992 [Kwoniella sp. DSM 27419]
MPSAPLQVLFMGTGTSTGLPLTPCLTRSNPYPEAFSDMIPLLKASSSSSSPSTHMKGSWDPEGDWPKNIPCPCCRSAVDPDVPEGWKNKRGNTSILVRRQTTKDEYKNILVDVGKTFREQAGRFFPKWGVKTIDAVLLTHGHADAYFGLDDLREWCMRQGRAIPVYLNQETYQSVCASFPYMVDKTKASGGGDVPTLLWRIIDDHDEFDVEGVNVKTLPVHHGIYFHTVEKPTSKDSAVRQARIEPEPLICLGFMFDNSVVYISDVSSIPDKTWDTMLKGRSVSSGSTVSNGSTRLPVFIVDALWPTRPHNSHFSFRQALEASMQVKAAYTYVVGSTHPTTHFMWEELCLSLQGESGQRIDTHPDGAQSEYLVKKVWQKALRGIGEEWKANGGIARPAWDGLVLEVPAVEASTTGESSDVERLDLSTRGLVF